MFRRFVPVVRPRLATVAGGLLLVVAGAVVGGLLTSSVSAQQAAAPTTRTFGPDGGLVLNFVKPDKTADFEMVMGKLKEALQKSTKPERKQQAASWKIFKNVDPM